MRPLRREQPSRAHQPQHPLAGHVDAVLAAQPGPDLAVALPAERRVGEHLADQHQQGRVIDRPDRARTCRHDASGPRCLASPAMVGRRPRCAQHPADPCQRRRQLRAHLGRFPGGISSPLFRAAARGCRCPRSTHRPCARPPAAAAAAQRTSRHRQRSGPSGPPCPARNSSRQAASRCASTRSSRDSSSSCSPRNNRNTASVFLFADQRTSPR